MVSVDTSYAASAAKFNTRDINKLISIVRKRIETGAQFTTPQENQPAWNAVQQFQQGIAAANATIASIAKNKAVIDVGASGVDEVGKILAAMASKITSVINGADATKAITELQLMQTNIKYAVASSVQGRTNILNGSIPGNIVLSLGASGSLENTHYFRPENVYSQSSGNSGYLGGSNSVVDTSITWSLVSNKDNAREFLKVINTAIVRNNVHASRLHGFSDMLANQSALMSDLVDLRTKAIAKLQDINMDDEKARLNALVARQQLVKETLAISSGSNIPASQNILNLFKGMNYNSGVLSLFGN